MLVIQLNFGLFFIASGQKTRSIDRAWAWRCAGPGRRGRFYAGTTNINIIIYLLILIIPLYSKKMEIVNSVPPPPPSPSPSRKDCRRCIKITAAPRRGFHRSEPFPTRRQHNAPQHARQHARRCANPWSSFSLCAMRSPCCRRRKTALGTGPAQPPRRGARPLFTAFSSRARRRRRARPRARRPCRCARRRPASGRSSRSLPCRPRPR